jgi:putative ABC transport system permease protein
VFAGVSLLVGSLVIWNSFNVVVAQRRREVALLRAVGATRRQVLGGVMIEAGAIGLVSGLVGLLVGIGLAAGIRSLLDYSGIELPTTAPALQLRTVLMGLAVGLLITLAAALVPAWGATRVTPMDALREAAPAHRGTWRARRTGGWVVTGAGLAVLAACIVSGNQRWWTVVGTVATFAGLVLLGPTLARGIARIADHGRRGGGWRMAARNVSRQSRRSAATALALTMGLTVVVAVAVTSASLKESVSDAVSGGNRSDLILEPAGLGLGISPSVAELLRDRDDVTDVVEVRESAGRVEGNDSLVTALDTVGLERVIDLGVETGSVDALVPGTLLVSTTDADDLGVGVGDSVTVTFPETGDTRMRVVGTFSKGSLINASYVMTMDDFTANVTSNVDGAIFMNGASGVDPDTLKPTIEEAVADYPNVEVNDPADITRDAQHSVDQLLGIVTALLLLAVIVAVLGIINTLVLSVVERTRELAQLRAVGATRRQVRTVIRRESLLMSLLGGVTGLGLGTLAGIALSRALADEGITTVVVPVAPLVAYLLVAAGVGVLAAVGPARRASRVDILRAVAAE